MIWYCWNQQNMWFSSVSLEHLQIYKAVAWRRQKQRRLKLCSLTAGGKQMLLRNLTSTCALPMNLYIFLVYFSLHKMAILKL